MKKPSSPSALLLRLICTTCLSLLLSGCDEDIMRVSIAVPLSGETIETLGTIRGDYAENGDIEDGGLVEVRLYLIRYSDGKYWAPDILAGGGAWAWGGGGSAIMPVSLDRPTKTWQRTGPLPTGASPANGLTDGYYNVIAIGVYEDGSEIRDDCIFAVNTTAQPVTSKLHAWGSNDYGQLGNAGVADSSAPVPVNTRGALDGKTVIALSGGDRHTLALTSEGRVYSWGQDFDGQLGRSTGPTSVPGAVEGLLTGKRIIHISAGASHCMAVAWDGSVSEVFGWGSRLSDQLGDGGPGLTTAPSPVAVVMAGALAGQKVVETALNEGFTMARTADGKVFAWGRNWEGQIGLGTNTASVSLPAAVMGLDAEFVSDIAAGDGHALAATVDGKVFAWGFNIAGQLGDGTTTNRSLPVQITGILAGKKIIAVAAEERHSLALDSDGVVYAWGKGDSGQLGNGSVTDQHLPVQVGGALAGKFVNLISTGDKFSFATTRDNKVYAWGTNQEGELAGATATGVNTTTPLEADFSSVLTDGRMLQALDCGRSHGLVLASAPPLLAGDIEVEAQGAVLVDGVSSNQILFGSQANGSTKSEWITVRNAGTSDLGEFDVEISGMNSTDFFASFSSQPPLKPNTVTGFYLHFKPTATGNREVTLRIRSSDPDEDPFDINVIGTGYEPGKPEPGFNAGLNSYAYTTVVQPDGKILIGGGFTSIQPVGTATPQPRGYIARLNADGTLDTAFHPNVDNQVHSIAVQHDGKILIGGYFTSLQPGGTGTAHTRICLARLNADGTVDTGFAVNVNGFIRCILPQRDGRILIGGQFYQINDGSGTVTRNRIARLHENGTLDTGFNPNANGEVLTMAQDSQNRIVVGGYFSSIGGATRYKLARLDPDGFADGFNPVSSSFVNAVAIESDGSVLVGGDFTEALPGGGTASNLLRVKPDGVLDNTFRPNPGYRIQGISVQADRSILISGSFTAVQPFGDPTPTTRNRMARLFPDGSLDVYFNPDANGEVYGSAIQADGKIIPAGSFNTMGGDPRNGTARLSNNTVTDILTVQSLSSIQWQRGGGAPETTDVRFDLSTDGGSTWSPLSGTVSRSPTGWEQTGITLPASGRIRARARTTSGNHNGSSGLVEKVALYSDVPAIAIYKDGLLQSHPDAHQYGVVATGGGAAIKVFTIENAGGGMLTGFTNAIIEDELSEPGDDASNFRFTMSSYPSSLANGDSTTIAVRYQPKTTGDHYALLRIPSNDHAQPEFFIQLKGTGSLPITTWKQIHFGQTENTGVAEDTATNQAGISRLAAYAQNLDPHTATSDTTSISFDSGGGGSFAPENEGAESPPLSGGTFFFNYTRNKLALADVVFQVEWSDTLAADDWHTDDVTEEILTDDGQQQEVKATIPSGSAGRRFVRLKMTRQ